jgi:hypothetical protein
LQQERYWDSDPNLASLPFLSGFDKLGWKYFLIYVVTNVTNAIVSYFLFPETKHRSLEEIVSCGKSNSGR